MNSLRPLALLTFTFLLVLAAGPAGAWTPSTVTDPTIIPLKWSGGNVGWRVNVTHLSNITGSDQDVLAATENGFAVWSNVSNTGLTITKVGNGLASDTVRNRDDKINTVLFADPQTNVGGALAVTFTNFNPSNGQMSDADIVFNTGQPFFTSTPDSQRFDLQSVLAHEIGHLLGLDHTNDLAATMFQSSPSGDTEGRTLGADDIAAIRSTYPGTTALGSLMGRVRIGGSGVLGAAVFAVDSSGTLASGDISRDNQGTFEIQGLPAGVYSIGIEPLDGPMQQGNIGGYYDASNVGVFNSSFITRLPSGSFTVSNGAANNVGDLSVTSGSSKFTLGSVVGITEPGASSFQFGSRVSFVAGTTGKELLVVHSGGITSSTQIGVTGSGVTLGTAISGSFTSGTTFRRFPLTVSTATSNDGHSITFTEGSDRAVIAGGFNVSGAQPPGADNVAPAASAGASKTVQQGVSVTLSAAGSSDPDGDALTYSWTQISGPIVTLNNNATVSPSFTASTNGILVFQVLVDDQRGGTASATVQIVVNGPPTVSVPASFTATTGQEVVLTGTAGDPDGNSLTFSWAQTQGATVSLVGASTIQVRFTPGVDGQFGFTLTVNDGAGGSAVSSEVIVTTVTPNRQPTASVGLNRTVTGTASVTLSGEGSSDPDGDTLTYQWQQISGPASGLVTASATTRDVAFTPGSLGIYQFRLTVSDGQLSDTADVSITRDSIPPTASISGGGTTTEDLPLTLSGAGSSDPDGESLTFAWEQVTGPFTLELATTDQSTLTFTPAHPGTYGIKLTVRDASNRIGTVTENLVVLRSQFPPVADAGADRNVALAASVDLDGSGSRDPQFTTLTYSWVSTSGPGVVSLSGAATTTASFTPIVAGNYVFTLTVSNSDGLSDTDTVTIAAGTSTSTTAAISLQAGLNLISVPIDPSDGSGTPFTAAQLASMIGSPFAARVRPSSSLGSRFQVFDSALQTPDFPIVGGQGYLVFASAAGTVTVSGTAWPDSSRQVALQSGINLVGTLDGGTGSLTAQQLSTASGGIVVTRESSQLSSGPWRLFLDSSQTPTDFALTSGRGYLVSASSSRTVSLP